jgi:CRP-like cAMP-binding protein
LEDAIKIAQSSPWLSQIGAGARDRICAKVRMIHVPRNKYLFEMGDQAQDIYCVVDGKILITVPHPTEGMMVAHVMGVGRWFGEPATLGFRQRIMAVQARQDSTLLTLSRASVKEILTDEPELTWTFFNLMAWNVEEYLLHAVDLLVADPKVRVCSRLLTMSGRRLNALPSCPVVVPLSQAELALASNTSRSTVNQILTGLVEGGICELGYREVKVLDMERLSEIVEAGHFKSNA